MKSRMYRATSSPACGNAMSARTCSRRSAGTDSGRFWGRLAFRKYPGTIRVAVLPPIERGLSREALMRRLAAAFAEGAAALGTPVDNSVGSAPPALPSRAS